MDKKALELLEFDKVKSELSNFCQSSLGKELVERLWPMYDQSAVTHALLETSEARHLLDAGCHIPLGGLSDISEILGRVERGGVIQPIELLQISDLLRGSHRLKRYMADKQELAPLLVAYASGLTDLTDLVEIIMTCIEGSTVSSNASGKLSKTRCQIKLLEERIQERLNSLLSSKSLAPFIQDSFVSVKDGRFVIPIKATYKHKVDGLVVASSGSGSTVFIEPAVVRRLVNELQVLRADEEAEVYQVLAMLAGDVLLHLAAVTLNMQTMAAFDFALAKGRYSRALQGVSPVLNTQRRIKLQDARHPLLGSGAVPLQFSIGQGYRTLLITGPNTGGKTVTLKTVGLLTAMAQAGLHIPAAKDSETAIFQEILADIGDGQSLEQSLSTFSSHMGTIAGILQRATPGCLILLDEIGTGTDPREGAALGAAVLAELYRLGAVTVATTHYGDLKTFAENHRGFRNARMDFDPETLRPLYQLVIGESGESNGLWIAERLGIAKTVVNHARELLGQVAGPNSPGAAFVSRSAPETSEETQIDQTPVEHQRPGANLTIGDRVYVPSLGQSGIISSLPDRKGMMTIIVKRRPLQINHRRVTLQLEKEELYPDQEDYDLNIVLISKEDRKLVKKMAKRHVPGAVRVITPGQ